MEFGKECERGLGRTLGEFKGSRRKEKVKGRHPRDAIVIKTSPGSLKPMLTYVWSSALGAGTLLGSIGWTVLARQPLNSSPTLCLLFWMHTPLPARSLR